MSFQYTLIFLAATLAPVMAECDPSTAVVAVVSVVATLVVVALILLGVYLFLRIRRKGSFLKARKTARPTGIGDMPDGIANAAFDGNDVTIAEQGLSNKLKNSNNNSPSKKKNQDGSKDSNAKTWSSFPKHDQSGFLYRQGSCGSLDEYSHSDPEIISVCLESQDIIGLGFNICGNFGQGIQVSQVHNRGPAIESGKIKVGDKILSVTVSYENIVYEDALTILSYASPYPVKITLQKVDSERPRDSTIYKRTHSGTTKDEIPSPTQLNHPLYRSQSLDALKRVQGVHGVKEHSNLPFAAKRAQSEMKPETRKDGSRGRKGDRNSKSFVHDVFDKIAGSISSSRSNSNRKSDVVVSEVVVHNDGVGTDSPSKTTYQNVQMAAAAKSPVTLEETPEMSNSATEFASLMDEMLDLNHERPLRLSINSDIDTGKESDEQMAVPRSPPNKPERKNKRQESLESSMSNSEQDSSLNSTRNSDIPGEADLNLNNPVDDFVTEVIDSSSVIVTNSIRSQTESSDDEAKEEMIQPSITKREIKIGDEYISVGQNNSSNRRDESMSRKDALDSFSRIDLSDMKRERPPSPDGDEIEEEMIEAAVAKKDLSIPVPLVDKEKSDVSAHSEKNDGRKEKSNQPALDEKMLEKLIAMNSYAPGTQGWAGIEAGGEQGGIVDDFIPNSTSFMAQPVPREQLQKALSVDENVNVDLSRPMSPPSVAYEIRDDVISGKPMAVEINKPKNVLRTSSYNTLLVDSSSSLNEKNVANKSISLREGSNNYVRSSKGSNINNNDSTDNYDVPLAWSGQRLVRAGSFSNIPKNNSVSDWTEKIIQDDDDTENRVQVDDLTDSDSEGFNTDNVPQVNLNVKDKTKSIEINESRSKQDHHSDMSNSATSSSGEATPPYQANGQEWLGSSPEFSLPTPPIHILSNEIGSVGKATTFSLSLDDSKIHDDVDC